MYTDIHKCSSDIYDRYIFQFYFCIKKDYLQTHYIYVYVCSTMHPDLNKLSNHWQTRECGQREREKRERVKAGARFFS